MPKNTKSSASSATRKKKAAKAAQKGGQEGPPGNAANPAPKATVQRGQKKVKGKGKEPRKKVFIPPIKPKQDVIDPLDSLGLASLLPSDLVVLLRKAGKKDVITRSRALEGLLEWANIKNDQGEDKDGALVMAIPCWAHLFPRLAVSPNRRLRLLTSQLNKIFLTVTIEELIAQPEHLEPILTAMLILAFDPDRQVSSSAKELWQQRVSWEQQEGYVFLHDHLNPLLSHVSTILFHESDDFASQAVKGTPPTTRDGKNRDDVNVEEDIGGTDARMVFGALGALGWLISSQQSATLVEVYEPLMSSPTLWTSLSPEGSSQQRSLGSLSPIVRTAAWQLIRTLASSWEALLDRCLPVLGFVALYYAFAERDIGVTTNMREGLVTLVRVRPQVWKSGSVEGTGEGDEGGDGDEDNESSEDEAGDEDEDEDGSRLEDNLEANGVQPDVQAAGPTTASLFFYFTDWLSSGLKGSKSNYDIVIVLLSTIPSEVYPPTSHAALNVLHAMYRPVDEDGLEGREAIRCFVTAYLECLIWSVARVNKLTSKEEALAIVNASVTVIEDFAGKVTPSERTSGQLERAALLGEERLKTEFGLGIRKLGMIDVNLAKPFLDRISSTLKKSVVHATPSIMQRYIDILRAATRRAAPSSAASPSALKDAVHELVTELIQTTANIVASGEVQAVGVLLLSGLMSAFSVSYCSDSMSSLKLVFDRLRQPEVDSLAAAERARFFVAYVACIDEHAARQQAWAHLLDSMVFQGRVSWPMLEALRLAIGGTDDLVNHTTETALDSAVREHFTENSGIMRHLLASPSPFIQQDTVAFVLEQIALRGSEADLLLLGAWLHADRSRAADVMSNASLQQLVPRIAHLALLRNDPNAERMWGLLNSQKQANDVAIAMLKNELISVKEPLETILSATQILDSKVSTHEILPDEETFAQLLEGACLTRQSPSLAILDPLLSSCPGQREAPKHDEEGLSPYARCSIALLQDLEEGSNRSVWVLPHLVSLALAAEDSDSVVGAGCSHFAHNVAPTSLVSRAIRVATSILSSNAGQLDEAWYVELTKALRSGNVANGDQLIMVLQHLWDTPNSARIFSRLLRGILNFSGAGEKEAVHLLRLAQATQDSKASKASAIYLATKDLIQDSPVYDRIRNELAARLAGCSSSKANTEGVMLLRLLNDAAPPTNSEILLVPQQRCIFLLQTLQKWIASDESEAFASEIHALVMQLLGHLLPIVQDIPGSHLPFICDLIDVNLSDGMGDVVCVYHSLTLVELFHSLAACNANLREVWKESKVDIFENVRDLFLAHRSDSQTDVAVQAVEEIMADAIRIAPESLFTAAEHVDSLLQIISTGSASLQLLAYRLLSNNVREMVKELVVEVAVGGQGEGDGEDLEKVPTKEVKLADGIVAMASRIFDEEGNELAHLLAWLILFDYFEESSLPLKAVYTSQFQNAGLFEKSFLPFFFAQTGLTFDPSRWIVDEIYIDELESSPSSISVLTSHVLYRSLIHIPSLVRESFNDLKDRQQSLYLRSFIMRHLTPLLSQREFGHLRDAATVDWLTDENMSIKVLAGSSEVIATYTVDEYPLEISIAMPNDFPLRNVEIKDLKKIGVSEGTWRAWILSIRQLIAGRNGLIFDALMLFKRNAEAKFSGFDEDSTCAVCYSIVSPTDHSLPTKPCKTCKKKFHASCLYKWVSTSGSSTCPLCRSIL